MIFTVRRTKKTEGLNIHRKSTIEYNCVFGKLERKSAYLWRKGNCFKVLIDRMRITHQGRSEAVNRALSDFGIEGSFEKAISQYAIHLG